MMQKKRNILWIPALLLSILVLSSCVSKKKYEEMELIKQQVQDLLDGEKNKNEELQTQKSSLEKDLADCKDAREKLQKENLDLTQSRDQLAAEIDALNASCAQVRNNYRQLKSKSTKKLKGMVEELETLQKDLAERERRLKVVEGRLAERDSVMNSLKKRLADALLGFKDKGLTVEIKDGKVYVSLSNRLLFASGSTKIDQSGQQALKDLALVLKEEQDITIMVEGHTDDVPVSNLGTIKDNWDLSVMRSTEVVRIIVAEGVNPTRIIPSGRSEFIPLVSEKTPEARASNRRTEIVISPQLDVLYNLINNKEGE